MTREKRSYTRITLDVPASLSLYQMETYHNQAIKNISLGGCYFLFEDELPLKERCAVTITIEEGLQTEKVTITGIVVRSDTRGAGIQFTDNSPENILKLEKIISCIMSSREKAQSADSHFPSSCRLSIRRKCGEILARINLFVAAAKLDGVIKGYTDSSCRHSQSFLESMFCRP